MKNNKLTEEQKELLENWKESISFLALGHIQYAFITNLVSNLLKAKEAQIRQEYEEFNEAIADLAHRYCSSPEIPESSKEDIEDFPSYKEFLKEGNVQKIHNSLDKPKEECKCHCHEGFDPDTSCLVRGCQKPNKCDHCTQPEPAEDWEKMINNIPVWDKHTNEMVDLDYLLDDRSLAQVKAFIKSLLQKKHQRCAQIVENYDAIMESLIRKRHIHI